MGRYFTTTPWTTISRERCMQIPLNFNTRIMCFYCRRTTMLNHRMEVVLLQDTSPVKESSISIRHHVLLPNTIIYVLRARQKLSASMKEKGRKEILKACHKILMQNIFPSSLTTLNQTFPRFRNGTQN